MDKTKWLIGEMVDYKGLFDSWPGFMKHIEKGTKWLIGI